MVTEGMTGVVRDAHTDETIAVTGVWPVLVYESRPATLPKAVVMMLGNEERATIVSVFTNGGLLILDEHPIQEEQE